MRLVMFRGIEPGAPPEQGSLLILAYPFSRSIKNPFF
jgi:hypothetical protein